MSDLDNSVTIEIRTVDSSSPVIQKVETQLVGLGTAGTGSMRSFSSTLTGMTGQLQQIAAVGAGMPPLVPPIPPEVPEQLNKIHGNMREVSGTAHELGINMGYSMRRFLADSPAVMSALQAMSTLFIGLAAIEIGAQIIEGVHRLYEKWFDVNKELLAYQTKAGEAAQQKLFDEGSLETEVSLLRQAGDEFDRLQEKRAAVNEVNTKSGIPFAGFLGMVGAGFGGEYATGEIEPGQTFSPQDDADQAKRNADRDKALERTNELYHQQALEEAKLGDNSASLKGRAQINEQQRVSIAQDVEELRYTREREQTLQQISEDTLALQKAQGVPEDKQIKLYKMDPDAGVDEFNRKVALAQHAAAERGITLTREETEEEIAMRNKAIEAGMGGEALFERQRDDGENKIRRAIADGATSRAAGLQNIESLEMEFHNAQMKRLDEEQFQTRKMEQEAEDAGYTGAAKILAGGQSQLNDLNAPNKNYVSSEDKDAQRAAIEKKTDAEIEEAHRQFVEELAGIDQRSVDQAQIGFAKIEAGTDRMLGELAKKFEQYAGQLDPFNPAQTALWLQATQDVANEVNNILANAERERVALAQRNSLELIKLQDEESEALLPPAMAAQQKIRDQYDQTAAKAKADMDAQLQFFQQLAERQGGLTQEQAAAQAQVWNQYYQTVTAEAARAQAEMEKQAEQTRDELAGKLQSLFDNPAKFMEARAKQMMMDILANWVMQLEDSQPKVGGAIAGLLGMGPKMSTSTNPAEALGSVFGIGHHGTAGAGEAAPLVSAGSTLSTAGVTLNSSGTMLASAAVQLSQAATAWESAAYSGGGGGYGGGTGAGSGFSAWTSTGGGGGGSFGGGGYGGGAGIIPPTGSSGLLSTVPGMAGAGGAQGIMSTISGGAGMIGQFAGLLSQSSTASLMNPQGIGGPGGGLQATDLPPTSSSGVLGTVPDNSTGMGSTDSSGGSGGMSAMGMAGGMISGGMGLFGAFESASNASSFSSGLMGMASGALAGASIGAMFGPIGMGIGAAAGALVGLLGDIFGDHGASKARQYNSTQILPELSQMVVGYSGGQSDYDQASLALNNLQTQAEKQCHQWGTGAMGVYQGTIVPEIQQALATVNREGAAGRSNVTMSGAQFATGGWVNDFMDMALGPDSGLILAHQGEHVMNVGAAAANAPWLDAMNRGMNMTSALSTLSARSSTSSPQSAGAPASVPGNGSAPRAASGGGGGDVHIHIHAWDGDSVDRWLRQGGAQKLQAAQNANTSRYSGRALG